MSILKKSFLLLMVMLLFAAWLCSAEDTQNPSGSGIPAAEQEERSGNAEQDGIDPDVWDDDDWGEPDRRYDPDYRPETCITLPDGTVAKMDQAEYPVGTPFVSYTLTRPQGGIAYFSKNTGVSKREGDYWIDMDGPDYDGRSGDLAYTSDGWGSGDVLSTGGYLCDEERLIVPLDGTGALQAGQYRLEICAWQFDEPAYLAFTVSGGAPQPKMPEPVKREPVSIDIPQHDAPWRDAKGYNSCADTSRIKERLLVNGTMYELRGVDESDGWSIFSDYSLFAYPEGHPERAALLAGHIDHENMTLYDLGDGLLLCDGDRRFYRCKYDGSCISDFGTLFDEEEQAVISILPAGGGIYILRRNGIWYTEEIGKEPELVYRQENRIVNNDAGSGKMVFAEGRLLIADLAGILSIDTQRRDRSGLMPAIRITETYNPKFGSAGYGYIVLNGRLYCWSVKHKATVSMRLDGSDVQEVSKEHFYFHQVTPSGVVLTLTGKKAVWYGNSYEDAGFFFPPDPLNPSFDPDHSVKRAIDGHAYDFIQGGFLYHQVDDRNGVTTETREDLRDLLYS